MRLKSLFFLFFLICALGFTQAPEKFTYQSVIKNSSGYLLKNQEIGLRISILFNSSNGMSVYSEEHTVESNSNGLVTLIIGEGVTSDVFNDIDWGSGEYYLKVEVDPNGGINYTMNQTSQLLSVPYALYAGNSNTKLNLLGQDYISLNNQTLTINKIDLNDDVDGILSVNNGGTGTSTAPMIGVITAADAPAARLALGLGTAAITASGDYATSAQGALADTALQDATAFATSAQGALADTALQDATAFATAAQGVTADAALPAANVSTFGATLIDDADAATARTTLELGTAAITASGDYATAAQGVTADAALPAANVSTFGATLIDDADAATARTTLELGTAATTNALTFGIADTNVIKVDDTDAADDDFAKFTANGIEGRDASEMRTDLGIISGIITMDAVTSITETVAGITANSHVVVSFKSGKNGRQVVSVVPGTNSITINLSGDSSSDAKVMFIAIK
jgi:hypothetical protein